MTNLSVFDFNAYPVRVILLDGEPWFVAKDICEILDLSNSSQALSRLDEDEKGTIILNDGTPGNPEKSIVSESGMYALVLSSRKESAKPFRKWVTSEVLPSIRETGSYTKPDLDSDRQFLETTYSDKPSLKDLKFVSDWLGELHGTAYKETYVHQKLTRFYPALSGDPVPAKERVSLKSADVLLTPTEIAKELGFKYKTGNPNPKKVNKLLEALGCQEKAGTKWQPTERGKQFCELKPVATNSRTDKDQLLWKYSIIDVLKEHQEVN